jgi:hypothetical protein
MVNRGVVDSSPAVNTLHQRDNLMTKEITTEDFFFDILDALRESGQMNMFGAPRYLTEEFGLEKNKARAVVKAWMARKE